MGYKEEEKIVDQYHCVCVSVVVATENLTIHTLCRLQDLKFLCR